MPKKVILSIVLLELFIGGGGRLIDTGILSIRMMLFISVMILATIMLARGKTIGKDGAIIVILSTLSLLISCIVGLVNNAPLSLILTDVKPLIFISSILFFFIFIEDRSDIELIVKLLKYSSLLLAVSYLVVFFLIHAEIIPFSPFYKWVEPTQEFFFRGEFAFFYKGFLYMCIGVFFFYTDKNTISKFLIIIVTLAILLTFTRGFFLAFGISLFIYIIFSKSTTLKKIAQSFLVISSVIIAFAFIANIKNLGLVNNSDELNHNKSDGERIIQINQVLERVTPTSFFIGHGLGVGVPSRPIHMEISYLEIFHKQGLIGLLFWGALFFYGVLLYYKAKNLNKLSTPFYLSFLFVFAQSLTNPFINNPIGLSMIILCLSAFRVFIKEDKSVAHA